MKREKIATLECTAYAHDAIKPMDKMKCFTFN